MVARSGQIRRHQFEAALDLLSAGDVTLLGVVLNDVPAGVDGAYGAGYYYHHAGEPDATTGHRRLARRSATS